MAGINFTNQIKMRTPPTEPNHVARKQDIEPVFLTQAEYDALEDPASSGLYPSLTGKRVIITDDQSIEYSYFVAPDGPKRENINRISNNMDSWIADRSGFVSLHARSAVTPATADIYLQCYVNGVSSHGYIKDDPGTGAQSISGIAPVLAGDVIQIAVESPQGTLSDTSVACYFIPPKFVKILAPVVMEEPDYGLSEVKLPTKWIDGETRYRKTIAINQALPSSANTDLIVPSGITNLGQVIDLRGMVHRSGGQYQTLPFISNSASSTTDDLVATLWINPVTANVCIRAKTDLSVWIADFVTVEYTKTTDV
jgi:hypothetical protein